MRIFLIDDHPVTRRGISLILEQDPEFETVGESSYAWEAMEDIHRLRPDVVIMETGLHGLTRPKAAEFISDVRATCSEIGVVVLTHCDNVNDFRIAMKAGAEGYLSKSDEVGDLVKGLRSVHSGQTYFGPRIAAQLGYGSKPRNGDVRLSRRESQVLHLIAEARTNKAVAEMLGISPFTVQTYRQRFMKKLGLGGRSDLLRYALRRGIIFPS